MTSKAIEILNEKKNDLEKAIEIQTQKETYHQEVSLKATKRKNTLINERESIISAIKILKGCE